MSEEDFIIQVYCLIEETLKKVVADKKIRKRGEAPSLTDGEVLTMLIVGEYLGLGNDKKIWDYFKRHWLSWFPGLGCRTSFIRQSANLWWIQNKLQEIFSEKLCNEKSLFLFDGFPIPTCHIKRYKRSKLFKEEGAVGYCAAKNEKYFGFKGNILITQEGAMKMISVTPANVDERDVLPEVTIGLQGDIIADKGLIRPELSEMLLHQNLLLHTPLRKNMKDSRPLSFIHRIMDIRRKVETVIGQLVERFKIQSIKAKDSWHLMAKIGRKILAHTICFYLNKSLNPSNPLQLENLMA